MWASVWPPRALAGRGDAGAALVDLADGVMFTGAVATGRKVAALISTPLRMMLPSAFAAPFAFSSSASGRTTRNARP